MSLFNAKQRSGMAESLNVIALISGGKDSFYSLLHCLQNGHEVVALGNLYPAAVSPPIDTSTEEEEDHDLNSFMYQTVGHSVIPLYEKALGIPLYRQQILGTAVQTETSYGHPDVPAEGSGSVDQEVDETESLVPLLMKIMNEHPSVNALSTGAILSTYQRTRIESVALRLGLIPLGYLWQYPVLPPGSQISLLDDMSSVGLDARIVKVASGGLDESFLWQNVASLYSMQRVEKAMKRFGTDGDGAVLGEGGEFETLVVDGPSHLFKGKLEIKKSDRITVREGGGSAWLSIKKATVVEKEPEVVASPLRTPELLEARFSSVLETLKNRNNHVENLFPTSNDSLSSELFDSQASNLLHWTVAIEPSATECSISEEAEMLVAEIKQSLNKASLQAASIVSTTILLRQMEDFPILNKIYGTLFTKPNPPSRVTISCGDTLPIGINIVISVNVYNSSSTLTTRKALHVQSRSYWAPANIGPYSQAISIPVRMPESTQAPLRAVTVAGQIPLVPHTMVLPVVDSSDPISHTEDPSLEDFKLQTVLSLQHLWRIGIEMQVGWWTSAVAYLPRGTVETISKRAAITNKAWSLLHTQDDGDVDLDSDDERDIWEERYHAGMESRGGTKTERFLPNWSFIDSTTEKKIAKPPLFTVEVEELPRQSGIEWHAHLGITGGPIKVYSKSGPTGWTIYQCKFGNAMHSIIAVEHLETHSLVDKALKDALHILGHFQGTLERGYSSYVDTSIFNVERSEIVNGIMPCRSIWGDNGTRLSAIFLFEDF